VFHKTRTDLRKWFLAAYLIGHDKRGVSAMFISRELGLRYDTAWLMCHKLRHALTENTSFKLEDFVEIDEAFYGGRRQKGNRGRAQTSGKVLIVCAVEKRSVAGTNNKGINQQGYVGGDARIAVIPNATAGVLGGFIQSAIKPGTWIVSDGFKGYSKSKLTAYRHIPITQGADANAASVLPIVHKVFSNIKAWLNGTYHGVSAKHLPRYLREWSYRFNRRGFIPDLDRYLLRRAAGRATITYGQLVAGRLAEGAP
jgi:transposase-like protein